MPTRPHALLTCFVLISALLGSTRSAPARQTPAIESGEKLVNVSTDGGHPTMRDAKSGEVLLDYRGVPLFDTAGIKGALEPGVQVQIQPAGFDIIYTFRNKGDAPAPMATLKLGIITLGEHATYQDMRRAQDAIPADPGRFPVRWLDYPGAVYSPVSVFRNDRCAIGVSLQYPLLEYAHDVRITLRSPGGRLAQGAGGRGFEVDHALSAPADGPAGDSDAPPRRRPAPDHKKDREPRGGTPPRPGAALPVSLAQPAERDDAAQADEPEPRGPWPDRPGLVPPGQQRIYTISVRITRTPEEWVRTLVPYRDYFRRLYGGVTYQRHTGPVNGVVMANFGRISTDNPYGWVQGQPRPDQAGYKPWADELKRRKGWSGFMLWMPTGMYDKSVPKLAFPYQIATRWSTDPRLASALDRKSGLASIPATGAELGLWFNRCLQVAREWNAAERAPLDPGDSSLTGAAFAEIDAAAAAGATMIGLDTFSTRITPAWQLYPWLKALRSKYPNITFVTEPITFDVMHTLAPTFLRGYDDAEKPASLQGLYKIHGPHTMADFLLPGHETWGGMRYGGYRWFNVTVTPEIIAADAQQLASWGYRPLLFTNLELNRPVQAAESWRTSIPPDLQLPDPQPKK